MHKGNPEGAALAVRALGHTYPGGVEVLTDVSFTLAPGELTAVLGASGSGKSTLLRAVAGFVTPTAGELELGGEVVCSAGRERCPAERRRVGMVFQDYALFPHMSVFDNVAFGLPKGPDRLPRVEQMLSQVGLGELAKRAPAALSGGQQQRVALARALAPAPALLLLDEPFANLDAALRMHLGAEIRDLLAQGAGARRTGAMLVTHDREEALGLADRVVVLGPPEPGAPSRLLQWGTPEAVYHQPATAAVARLTGDAAFLHGDGRGDRAETALGVVALSAPAEGPVTVVVRPEQLRFSPEADGVARVRRRRFQGARYHLDLHSPAGPISLECSTAQLAAEGLTPMDIAPGCTGRVHISGGCAAVR